MASMQNGYGSSGGGNDEDDRKPPATPNNNKWNTPSVTKKRRRRNRGDSTVDTDSTSDITAIATELYTPGTDFSVASLSPNDTTQKSTTEVVQPVLPPEQRRLQLQQQMMVFSAASSVAFGAVVLSVLPMVAILAIGLLAASLGLLSNAAYQRLLLEYQQIVSGDGFGRYLSPSIYQQLTEGSLHQYLTQDNQFVREWGFLALYFVPGLTEEQRDQYIRRLAPDRQQFLQRPGLGYLLGEGFMRALVGDQRWRRHAIESSIPRVVEPRRIQPQQSSQQQQIQIQSPPLQIAATGETPARRLEFDSDNESMASTSPDVVGLTIEAVHGDNGAAAEGSNNNNNNSEENSEERERQHQRQLDEEGQVVISALFTGGWSYVSWLAGLGGEAAYDFVVEPTSSMVSTAGIGASVLSLGMGFWGISTGFYSRPGSSTASFRASSLLPSSRVLVGTALLGGVSAGVMLYARSTVRNAVKTPSKPPAPKKNPGDGGSGKK